MTSIYTGASDNCWPLFSSYAEFAAESGVEELISDFDENQPVSVYNLSGIYVGSTTDNLASDSRGDLFPVEVQHSGSSVTV